MKSLLKWTLKTVAASSMLLGGAAQAHHGCDVMMKQSDFNDGTYIIKAPGTYCLKENVSFNPNNAEYLRQKTGDQSITAYESSNPLRSQLGYGPGQYDPAAYGLGFFAAIAVASPDVTIDLRGKRIEQSKEHALMQRFFAVIEAADRPFINGQGPFDFGTIVGAAENLTIKNGTIGRSAHHGIHGNRAKNVRIENIRFQDFEVAAVAMNGVDGMTLKNLRARSRRDVPVLGQYSTARFIQPYVDYLVMTGSSLQFNGKSAADIQASLKTAVNNVHHDLIVKNRRTINKRRHNAEWRLFHNKKRIVDGNSYGFLINGVGVAVGGFPSTTSTDSPSKNITIQNVRVDYLAANIREVIALAANGTTPAHVKDAIGSVWQVLAVDPQGRPLAMNTLSPETSGRYVGNAVTDAQALVAKASNAGLLPSFLDARRNSITPAAIAWAESGAPLSTYTQAVQGPNGTGFICNGDQMFHVNKGVIGFKLDGSENVSVRGAVARNIRNIGKAGSKLCGAYEKSIGAATLPGYGGAITRGFSVSGSKNVDLKLVYMSNIYSRSGSAVGVDVLTDSQDVSMKWVKLHGARASRKANTAPTAKPEAIGFRIGADTQSVSLFGYCARALKAHRNQTAMAQDNSSSANVRYGCHH